MKNRSSFGFISNKFSFGSLKEKFMKSNTLREVGGWE